MPPLPPAGAQLVGVRDHLVSTPYQRRALRERSRRVIPDEDLELLRPQYEAVRKALADYRLSASLDDLAAFITLKVVAITWGQVIEAAPELRGHDGG